MALFALLGSTLYTFLFFSFYSVKYKSKPSVFITNDYYSWKGGSTYAKFAEFDEHILYDVIFLGSSRAYRGYSPFVLRDFGYKSFNLGTPAQSVKNSYFITKHYLNSSNCKLLLLDVYALNFINEGIESSSDLIENISKPEAAIDLGINTDALRSLNIMALRLFTQKDSCYYTSEDYIGLGYSCRNDKIPSEQISKTVYASTIREPYSVSQIQLEYLDKLIRLTQEKDIKLVVVYSPVSILYKKYMHQPFLDKIKPILNRHNVAFYDFSHCDSLTTYQHFYDMSHLNQSGVEIFNRSLFRKLIEDKLIH